LTYYDDATGERAGLTAEDLGSWTSAVSALLTDGLGLGPGSRAAVLLPPHWQSAAVLLGAWAAGVEVSFQGWATAGLAAPTTIYDVSFVAAKRVGSWLEEIPPAKHQFVLGLAPHGGPTADVPDGYRDFLAELGPHAEAAPPAAGMPDTRAATPDGTTYREMTTVAAGIAESKGFGPGDRVLVDAANLEHPLFWLLAPLTAGASLVVCANLDPAARDARVAAERITHVLGGK
jgi:uncharacterized protein (TIGR03089 family)